MWLWGIIRTIMGQADMHIINYIARLYNIRNYGGLISIVKITWMWGICELSCDK